MSENQGFGDWEDLSRQIFISQNVTKCTLRVKNAVEEAYFSAVIV